MIKFTSKIWWKKCISIVGSILFYSSRLTVHYNRSTTKNPTRNITKKAAVENNLRWLLHKMKLDMEIESPILQCCEIFFYLCSRNVINIKNKKLRKHRVVLFTLKYCITVVKTCEYNNFEFIFVHKSLQLNRQM